MANELKHAVVGEQLTKAEWEALNAHVADGQTANDMLYFNGTYWIRATPVTIAAILDGEIDLTNLKTKPHSALSDAPSSAHHTKYTDADARSAAISDTAYASSWDGVTTIAPSKNAVYDKIETLGVSATIATGSYTGTGSNDRQITVGFKCSMVIVQNLNTRLWICWRTDKSNIWRSTDYLSPNQTDVLLHATDGFVVDNLWANQNEDTYWYWAISE